MENLCFLAIVAVIFIYEFVVLPMLGERNLDKYMKTVNGQIVKLQRISARDQLYLVEYKVDGTFIRRDVRCNLLGQITEWI